MESLFDRDDSYTSYVNTDIGKRASQFDAENPEIYLLFKECAEKARRSGHKRYSANGIFEYIRWNLSVEKKGEYKMDNSFRAYFARKLMYEDNRFKDFFEIRGDK